MNPETVRAVAEVLAADLWNSRRQSWEDASREAQEQMIDRVTPLAEKVVAAVERHQ